VVVVDGLAAGERVQVLGGPAGGVPVVPVPAPSGSGGEGQNGGEGEGAGG
jgi:hypothetical protein